MTRAPDELVERLRGLLAKATAGPFKADEDRGFVTAEGGKADLFETKSPWHPHLQEEWDANCALIAETLNALPTLIARLTSAEARAEKAEGALANPFRLNINVTVRVRLTDAGRAFHRERHGELYPMLAYQAPAEDAEGWSKWQLWTLMQEFGGAIYNGCKVPFATTIEIVPDAITTPQPVASAIRASGVEE